MVANQINVALPEYRSPTTPTARIASIDVLRGVAVLGILLVNIVAFGLPFELFTKPDLLGNYFGADVVAFWGSWVLVEGSQRAIFTMLFGAGVILLTSRLSGDDRRSSMRGIYMRRNAWLFVFGLIDAYLLYWSGDILFLYGLVGLLLYLFRNVKPRNLFISGVLVLFLASVLVKFSASLFIDLVQPEVDDLLERQAAGQVLSDEDLEFLELMRGLPGSVDSSPEELQAEIDIRAGGYASVFVANALQSLEFHTATTITFLFWDVLGLMLIGMALFQMNVFDASKSTATYARMAVIGLTIGYGVNIWEVQDSIDNDHRSLWLYWSYDIGRLASGLGYIGVVMLICRTGVLPRVQHVLSSVGRMALTNYIMQSVICLIVFVLFGLFGKLRFHELYYVVLAIWSLQLAYSPWWLSRFQYGPLEWVWRGLTYGKAPPFKRDNPNPA